MWGIASEHCRIERGRDGTLISVTGDHPRGNVRMAEVMDEGSRVGVKALLESDESEEPELSELLAIQRFSLSLFSKEILLFGIIIFYY